MFKLPHCWKFSGVCPHYRVSNGNVALNSAENERKIPVNKNLVECIWIFRIFGKIFRNFLNTWRKGKKFRHVIYFVNIMSGVNASPHWQVVPPPPDIYFYVKNRNEKIREIVTHFQYKKCKSGKIRTFKIHEFVLTSGNFKSV